MPYDCITRWTWEVLKVSTRYFRLVCVVLSLCYCLSFLLEKSARRICSRKMNEGNGSLTEGSKERK